MINNSVSLDVEVLLKAYNFKRINVLNIVYVKHIEDLFIRAILKNDIIYLQLYVSSSNFRESKRFVDKQEFIDHIKQLMNGKIKL